MRYPSGDRRRPKGCGKIPAGQLPFADPYIRNPRPYAAIPQTVLPSGDRGKRKKHTISFSKRKQTHTRRRRRILPETPEKRRKNIHATKECINALYAVEGNIAVFFTGYDMKKQYTPYCAQLCRETGRELMDESKEVNKQRMIEAYKNHGNAVLLGRMQRQLLPKA